MKKQTLWLLFLAAAIRANAGIDADIQALSTSYSGIVQNLDKESDSEKARLYGSLREQVSAMEFALISKPNGDFFLNKDLSERMLIEAIYRNFTADQFLLESVITHTNQREAALARMPERARCLVSLFPMMHCNDSNRNQASADELVYFAQYLARAYPTIPDALVKTVRSAVGRWQGEERIPGLLVLAENGDQQAKRELDSFSSQNANKLKTVFRQTIEKSTPPPPTPTPSPSASPNSSPSPSASVSSSPKSNPSPSASATPTLTPGAVATPALSASPSVTASGSPKPIPSQSATVSPTPKPSASLSPTANPSPTPSPR